MLMTLVVLIAVIRTLAHAMIITNVTGGMPIIAIYTLRDCRRPIAGLKNVRGRGLGAVGAGIFVLGKMWELWELVS